MNPTPSRFWAFVLVVLAGVACALPVIYTVSVYQHFGPWGTLLAWTATSVSIFGLLTVVVSFTRGFLAPAIRPRRRKKANL